MKDTNKVESLKIAGQIAAEAHLQIAKAIKPGVNLMDLEAIAEQVILSNGMQPAFLRYKGYPAVSCLSINDGIVHGIPHNYELREGDIISVDLGVTCRGWIVDTARTHGVGSIDPKLKKLLEVTDEALTKGIAVARVGNKTGAIGAAIQEHVESNDFAIVRDLTGHGVGPTLQEPPTIYNYGKPSTGVKITKGMVLAIEPITTLKPTEIAVAADGWTIISRDGSISAHFEDTILVTDGEPLILTKA